MIRTRLAPPSDMVESALRERILSSPQHLVTGGTSGRPLCWPLVGLQAFRVAKGLQLTGIARAKGAVVQLESSGQMR